MKLVSVFLLIVALVCSASGQGDSYVGPEAHDALKPAEAQLLRDGWKKLRGPSVLPAPSVAVVVGYRVGGKIIPQETQMEKVTRADIRAQLSGLGISVVSDDVAVKGLKGLEQAIRERAGQDTSLATAELLNEFAGAGILVEVELVPMADATRAKRLFRVLDARSRPARVVVEESFNDHEINAPGDRNAGGNWMIKMRRGSTEMLAKLGETLNAQDPYVPVYRVQALGLDKLNYDDWSRAIRQEKRPGLRLVRTPFKLNRTGSDVTPLWVEFDGEWPDLADVLSETARKATGMRMVTVFDSGESDFIVILQNEQGPWGRFVAKNAAPPQDKIGPLLSPARKPTVAILYGEDTNAPIAALQDERNELPRLTLSEEEAARTLGRYFSAAGFEVKDSGAIRRQLQGEIERANLGKNLSGMRLALRSSKATDFLVLVRSDAATGSLNLTVLDERAAQIAFTHYPDSRISLYETSVNVRDTDSLMRYLGGTLFEQLYDHATDASLLSVEVVLKNTRNAQQAVDVKNAFASLEGVKSVTDLKIDQPIARFNVNISGNADALVQRAAELANKKQLGAKGIIEFANEQQIVFNILPSWIGDFDLITEVPKVKPEPKATISPVAVPTSPATPPGVQPAVVPPAVIPTVPVTASSADTMVVNAMRVARDSIWIVGFDRADGKFIQVGTAWTVQPNLLATNGHVLGDSRYIDIEHPHTLLDIMAYCKSKGVNCRPVARNGANLNQRIDLKLESGKVHPGFLAFQQKIEGSGFIPAYDIAIIPTVQSAGTPLVLASTDELYKLEPLSTLGYSGYPGEDRNGEGFSQQTLIGRISALTSVFLMEEAQPAKRLLLQFSLTSAGGASGSPLFGPNGTVIGLLSAGDYAFLDQINLDEKGVPSTDKAGGLTLSKQKKRIPVGFTYGQRVDMLRELIDGQINMASIEQEWQKDYPEAGEKMFGKAR